MNIFVRGFSEINDVKMEYKFQITLRQKWNDERLQFKQKLGYNSQGMKLFYLETLCWGYMNEISFFLLR